MTSTLNAQKAPAGFTLLHALRGHSNVIYEVGWSPNGRSLSTSSADRTLRLWDAQTGAEQFEPQGHWDYVFCNAWSPDGQLLVSGSFDETIRVSNGENGKAIRTLKGHRGAIFSLTWSPDSQKFASGSDDNTIRIWHRRQKWGHQILRGHTHWVMSVAWSPNGRYLLSASRDQTVRLWDAYSGHQLKALTGHNDIANSVAWSPNGKFAASGSDDKTIRIWNMQTQRQVIVLEGHWGSISTVRFSPDGRLLASKSEDGTIRLWRCDTWQSVAVLDEPMRTDFCDGLAFNPVAPVLATLSEGQRYVRLWHLDYETLLGDPPHHKNDTYRNAKVILLGNEGIGKLSLARALTGKTWRGEPSAPRGRSLRTLQNETVMTSNGWETRELFLWTFAGDEEEKLLHQLYLDGASVALVAFNAHSESEPFVNVHHWARLLQTAKARRAPTYPPLKMYLVATKSDLNTLPVSHAHIARIAEDLGFDGFFETSAKEGWQIPQLRATILEDTAWELLPRVAANDLYQSVKRFLAVERASGRLLSTVDDLYRLFRKSVTDFNNIPNLRDKVEICLRYIENQNLIRRLRFGDYVLLNPRVLNRYVRGMIEGAKAQPDGLGFITEEAAKTGAFPIHKHIKNEAEEDLFLVALIEEILYYDIALKGVTENGVNLVFPSQFRRPQPHLPDMPEQSVRLTFEGSVVDIYATLAVRLSESHLFTKRDIWKLAATYDAKVGGTCGIYLTPLTENKGELTIFFDEEAGEATRYQFSELVTAHLERLAVPGSTYREQIVVCPSCHEHIPNSIVQRRRERGYRLLTCPVCDTGISLLDREERLAVVGLAVSATPTEAEKVRPTQTVINPIAPSGDVVLCYDSADETAVSPIRENLQEKNLSIWEPAPDLPIGESLSQDLDKIQAIFVLLGASETPWRDIQTAELVRHMIAQQESRLMLVFLPGYEGQATAPPHVTMLDLREDYDENMTRLVQLAQSPPQKNQPSNGHHLQVPELFETKHLSPN